MANVAIGVNPERIASGREYALNREHFITKTVILDSVAIDAGSSPTSTLRKGLILAKVTSSGRFAQYDNAVTGDGQETARGVLDEEKDMLDENGVSNHQVADMMIFGYVDNNALIGIDANGRTELTTSTNGCFFIIANV